MGNSLKCCLTSSKDSNWLDINNHMNLQPYIQNPCGKIANRVEQVVKKWFILWKILMGKETSVGFASKHAIIPLKMLVLYVWSGPKS